jgi:hypothetical protein
MVKMTNVTQTSSSHSDKRRKSSEGGNYESASNDADTILPDLNEDTTPTRPRKGKKSGGGEASSKTSVVENMEAYTVKKAQAVDEVSKKTQALLDIQIAQASQKAMRGDYKFFNQPHTHITDPIMLEWMLDQKRAIGAKYGWRCDF